MTDGEMKERKNNQSHNSISDDGFAYSLSLAITALCLHIPLYLFIDLKPWSQWFKMVERVRGDAKESEYKERERVREKREREKREERGEKEVRVVYSLFPLQFFFFFFTFLRNMHDTYLCHRFHTLSFDIFVITILLERVDAFFQAKYLLQYIFIKTKKKEKTKKNDHVIRRERERERD